MSQPTIPRWIAIAGVLGLAAPLAAQASSSQSYFQTSTEHADGGQSQSPIYAMRSVTGPTLVPEPCSASATYVVEGGFTATLDATYIGRPWSTGVSPLYVGPAAGPTITIHGTELDLGAVPTVTIGGINATVQTRSIDNLTVTLPAQPEPGFQPVEITNGLGTTRVDGGIGILPILDTVCPVNSQTRIGMEYIGSPGDTAVLLLGVAPAAVGFPVLNFGYSLQIDPGFLLASAPFVAGPDGRVFFDLPPTNLADFVVLQTLTYITVNPSYPNGSFSNLLDF